MKAVVLILAALACAVFAAPAPKPAANPHLYYSGYAASPLAYTAYSAPLVAEAPVYSGYAPYNYGALSYGYNYPSPYVYV